MLRAIIILSSFLISTPTAWADTTITLIFTNSGGEIQNLLITDKVCNQPMHTGHFAAGDLQTINGFCVRDTTILVAEISISADGADNSPARPVPANSTVDVATGRVTPASVRIQSK
jgi:hypothetical protein